MVENCCHTSTLTPTFMLMASFMPLPPPPDTALTSRGNPSWEASCSSLRAGHQQAVEVRHSAAGKSQPEQVGYALHCTGASTGAVRKCTDIRPGAVGSKNSPPVACSPVLTSKLHPPLTPPCSGQLQDNTLMMMSPSCIPCMMSP
jgi:hypothetical protein